MFGLFKKKKPEEDSTKIETKDAELETKLTEESIADDTKSIEPHTDSEVPEAIKTKENESVFRQKENR